MKIKIGKLKQLLREAADAGARIQAGKYYVVQGASWEPHVVAKVLDVVSSPQHPGMMFVKFKQRADSISTQSVKAFEERILSEATPEEAQQVEASWAKEDEHMRKTIDSSKEGT